ncbi:MAG: FMN-binding protein [Clostridia bacterium]|nr:FMN-binding protein [Clostridia bacterium]
MIFLISLALALLLVLALGKPLRSRPVPFYLIFTAIAAAVIVCTYANVRFPAWFGTWVFPVFARGALAGSLFVLVMAAGAFPAGSRGAKTLMPVRAQLSIIACILTLGHNVAYGKTYFVMLLTRPQRMPVTTLLAAICSIVMIIIMLPLFVTSFASVRRRMDGKRWKRLQRLAYIFYALLFCHIMLLAVPYAIDGRQGYRLTVFVYGAVFIAYAVCRLMKRAAAKTRTQAALPKRQLGGVLCGVLAAALMLGAVSLGGGAAADAKLSAEGGVPTQQTAGDTKVTRSAEDAPPVEQPPAEDTPPEDEPQPTDDETAPMDEPVNKSADEPTDEPQPAEDEHEPEPAPEPAPAPEPEPEPEPEPKPEPEPEPEPVRIYKDGTFSGSGLGNTGTSDDVTVSVTIKDDRIVSISITGFKDDLAYFDPDIEGARMISAMLGAQSANVDAVSGATYSSEGLIDAVKAALAKAKN